MKKALNNKKNKHKNSISQFNIKKAKYYKSNSPC